MQLGYMFWPRHADFGIQVDRPVEELLKEIAPLGYDNVEIAAWRSQQLFPSYVSKDKRKKLRKLIGDLGLKGVMVDAGGGCPHYSSEYGYLIEDTIERNGIIYFVQKCIDLAVDLGANKVLDLSGEKPKEMSEKRAWELLRNSVADICDYAADRGVQYLMEVEFGYIVHDADTGLQLAKEIDSKAFKMNFDYSNFLIDGATELQAQKAVKTLSNLIANAHIKGLKRGQVMGNYAPTIPGSKEDVQDLKGFFSALKNIGYTGSVNVEDLAAYQQPPLDIVDAAKLSYDNISRIMEESGIRKC